MTISRTILATCGTSLALLLSACGNEALKGPAFITQPAGATIVSGSNSVLSAVASGSNVTYQWYLDGTAIAGATAATYTATAAGTYYVVATGVDGAITSANALLALTSTPVITAQPSSATILTDTSQTLVVTATGAELSYQWYKDGGAIDGATHASYAASAAGSYTVAASNPAGSVTSTAAIIAVSASLTVPVISAQPLTQTVNGGTGVTFAVTASGVSVAYQWYHNEIPIPGATQSTQVSGKCAD
ncbi:MAG: immunoglobulin domain-containing protein [Pseudomonadota bacterium]